jgi:Domain of unknown function (DUF397)
MRAGTELNRARWRRSSHSNVDGGNCVEIADDFTNTIPVRDSKNPSGPVVIVGASAWKAFVEGLR